MRKHLATIICKAEEDLKGGGGEAVSVSERTPSWRLENRAERLSEHLVFCEFSKKILSDS